MLAFALLASTGLATWPAQAAAPRILSQPKSGTISASEDFAFDVLADGTPPFAYQWYYEGSPMPGRTNQVLSLAQVVAGQAGSYSVEVANADGSVRSTTAVLTVRDPAILSQPVGGTAEGGSTVQFSVDAGGTPPLSYQWRFKGVAIAGANNATLLVPNVTKSDAGTYSVVVSNASGSVTSVGASLTVNDPAVLGYPLAQTVTGGTNLIMMAYAGGTPPLTYEWRRNGVALPGKTNDVLLLNNVTRHDGGSYSVRVRNALGTAVSPNALLTVNDPVILEQPQDAMVSQGGAVCLTVQADGSRPLHYQWLFRGALLQGATNQDLCLTGVAASQAGGYSVRVTSPGGTVSSTTAILTVYDLTILQQPIGGTVAAGTNFQMVVEAAGRVPLSYQWLFNGQPLPGATASVLQLNNVTTSQAGDYQVRVSNPVGSVLSTRAVLAVDDPRILEHPQGGIVLGGDSFDLDVVAGGTAPFTYQWYRNGEPLPGATSSTLSLGSTRAGQAGQYAVAVTNAQGGVVSSNAFVVVLDPVLLSQPANLVVGAHSNVTFSVVAGGNGPFTYQWFRNGTALPGATGPQLLLNNVTPSQGGTYHVEVSNADATVGSTPARLDVKNLIMLEHPQGIRLPAGTNLTLSALADGAPPLRYQWYRNGALLAGQTNTVLSVNNLTKSEGGRYLMQVRNASGALNSTNALVTVDDPAILVQPLGGFAGEGESFAFEVITGGTEPIIYQWRHNSAILPGEVHPRLVLKSLTTTDAGRYQVEVRNAEGRIYSDVAQLAISKSTDTVTNAPRKVVTGEFVTSGNQAMLHMLLDGNGFEHGVSFSLSFDPTVLANPTFVPTGAATAMVTPAAGRVGISLRLPPGETYAQTNSQDLGMVQFSILPGRDPLLARIDFANDPTPIDAFDVLDRRMDLVSEVRPSGSLIDPVPFPDPQSGLLLQRFILSNPTAVDSTNLCITLFNLGYDSLSNSIVVYNGQVQGRVDADMDGVAEAESFTACIDLVGTNRSTIFTMEYLNTDHLTVPQPGFQFFFGTGRKLLVPGSTSAIRILSWRYLNGQFVLEFDTVEDFAYYVEYADSMEALMDRKQVRVSDPLLRGTGGTALWIDRGPPRTVAPPQQGLRFYRVLENFRP